MVKRTHIVIFVLCLILLFLSFIPINVINIHCIVIPELYMNIRIENSNIIEYTYLFTEDKIPVKEIFRINPQNTISLIRVEMDKKSDQVIPEFLLGDEEFKIIDNKYVIENIDKEFNYLELLVQKENNNTLIINNVEYSLSEYVDDSALITVENRKIPLFKYYAKKLFF